eukprot:15164263-Alexandrium_andersonii.AAC.1
MSAAMLRSFAQPHKALPLGCWTFRRARTSSHRWKFWPFTNRALNRPVLPPSEYLVRRGRLGQGTGGQGPTHMNTQ